MEREKGKVIDHSGKPIVCLTIYDNSVEVSYNTLDKYLNKKGIAYKIGAHSGKKPLLSTQNQLFIAKVFVHKDRTNKGTELSTVIFLSPRTWSNCLLHTDK